MNEQPNDYVIERFRALGYTYDAEASKKLREAATLEWFKTTLLVFPRGGLPAGVTPATVATQ